MWDTEGILAMCPGPRPVVRVHAELTIMCRVASTVLPSNARSPGQARTSTEMWLASWGIEDEGVITLLVSELVTNALKHARTTATLTVAVATGMIEVGVADHGFGRAVIPGQRGVDLPRVPGATRVLEASGRGLIIVDALAEEWGVSAHATGKQVWFRRSVPADWPFTGTCSCQSESPAARPLPSGRAVVAAPGPWDGAP
jgi:anti-sigma regulatory factor (Ser/Thr protein kinase)